MLILDGNDTRENVPSASPSDIEYISSCLETIFSNNVFQFFLVKILQTAAYQVCIDLLSYLSTYCKKIKKPLYFSYHCTSIATSGPVSPLFLFFNGQNVFFCCSVNVSTRDVKIHCCF